MMHSEVFDSKPGKRTVEFRTICEIHREIYDELVIQGYTDQSGCFVRLLEEAFFVGRRMAKKLIEHKVYDLDKIAAKGIDRETRERVRKERIRLQKIKEDL